jgi:hypothetical protein
MHERPSSALRPVIGARFVFTPAGTTGSSPARTVPGSDQMIFFRSAEGGALAKV